MDNAGRHGKSRGFGLMGCLLLVLAACTQPSTPDPSTQEVPGINGVVVDTQGRPVRNATVEVLPAQSEPGTPPDTDPPSQARMIDTTDAQGVFGIEIEHPGDYTLLVTNDFLGAGAIDIHVDQGAEGKIEVVEIQLTAQPLGHIKGNVILEGSPDNLGATVFIPGTSLAAQSDAQGDWIIEDVPPGEWPIVLQHAGYSRYEGTATIKPGEAITLDPVRLQLVAPLTIESFHASPNSGTAPQETTFDWKVNDPQGAVLSCSLDVDGDAVPDYQPDNSTEGSQTHTYTMPNSYRATFRVKSPDQQTQASIMVVIGEHGEPVPSTENQSPTADAGEDIEGTVGTPVLLDAGGSHDPDGDILQFAWALEAPNGTNATDLLDSPMTARSHFTPATAGTYTASITVTDGELTDRDTKTVSIAAPAPAIHELSHEVIVPRQYLTITGENFGDEQDESTIRVGGVPADDVDSWSNTEIRVGVPAATPYGTASVSVQVAGEETSADLTVIQPTTLVASYRHSIALTAEGDVASWGADDWGQTDAPDGLADLVAVAAGNYHSVALDSEGTVVDWGWGSAMAGDAPTDIVAISGGDRYTLGLKRDGTVVGWGYNEFGQTSIPEGLSNVVAISAGEYHGLALTQDGTVVAWGAGSYTEEGQADVPPGLTNVIAISAATSHSLALLDDGTVVAWGGNTHGQTDVPPDLTDVVAISADGFHYLALKSDGTVVAWGIDDGSMFDFGQTDVPSGLTDVVAISAGAYHSLALKRDGTVVSWGIDDGSSRDFGQTDVPAGLVVRVP